MNFILVLFKSEFTAKTQKKIKGVPTERRAKLIPNLFSKTIKNINKFHPNSNIHVLTDEPCENYQNIIFHIKKIDKNYKAKLEIFSLLSEPAMYMDLDILMLRPFSEEHMNPNCDFNLFHSYKEKLNYFSEFPITTEVAYNSGVIWVNKPNKKITEELQYYQRKFFNNLEKISKYNGFLNNDEYPIALFIDKHKLKMQTFKDVNVPRHLINFEEIEKCQSVHYNNENNKYLLIQEWQYFNNRTLLL